MLVKMVPIRSVNHFTAHVAFHQRADMLGVPVVRQATLRAHHPQAWTGFLVSPQVSAQAPMATPSSRAVRHAHEALLIQMLVQSLVIATHVITARAPHTTPGRCTLHVQHIPQGKILAVCLRRIQLLRIGDSLTPHALSHMNPLSWTLIKLQPVPSTCQANHSVATASGSRVFRAIEASETDWILDIILTNIA